MKNVVTMSVYERYSLLSSGDGIVIRVRTFRTYKDFLTRMIFSFTFKGATISVGL